MRTLTEFLLAVALISCSPAATCLAGTWSDDFSETVLGSDWRGNRTDFDLQNGSLRGQSAHPLASPLNLVEVATNWNDYVVYCRLNVVSPNLRVCSKAALILRHNGADGYVFALHTATQTIEIYRLATHEMLLSKPSPLEYKKWYRVRAELAKGSMAFFVDEEWIGTVTDERSLTGAVGVAVQDVEEALFDDFTVIGPAIPSNRLEALRAGENISLSWPKAITNYLLKATHDLSSPQWETITNQPAADETRFTVLLPIGAGTRYYRVTPAGP